MVAGSVRILIVLVSFSLATVGCTAAKFTTKDAALSKSVMDAEGSIFQGDDAGNGIQQVDNGNATGNLNQGNDDDDDANGSLNQLDDLLNGGARGQLNQPDGTNDEVDIRLICSDSRSKDNMNFKRALATGGTIVLALDGKICTNNVNEIKALVEKKNITIADAQRLCPELVPPMGEWASVEIIINGESNPSRRGVIELLYARNDDTSVPSEAADENCDKRKSPLVINIASDVNNPKPISLSSPTDGVFFDILGSVGNYVPVRISWFTNTDYRLLTLPNEDGDVLSIDELFGDNTLGPDGKYADDGYAALAKYDGKSADGVFHIAEPDGYITPADGVFEHLRLWLDENFNGRAEPHELVSLASVGISYIDLNYSTDYAEEDVYGNQTKMKSVVGYTDGTLDLIFDLWFNVNLGDTK